LRILTRSPPDLELLLEEVFVTPFKNRPTFFTIPTTTFHFDTAIKSDCGQKNREIYAMDRLEPLCRLESALELKEARR
jgi:hypothetical protein